MLLHRWVLAEVDNAPEEKTVGIAEAPRQGEAVITASLDLDRIRAQRSAWGLFRDRRPDLYEPLLTLGGETRRT